MINTIRDVMIGSEAEFQQLPDEGRWEVVDGRAILLPPNDIEHQVLSDTLVGMICEQLRALKGGNAVSAPCVFIPRRPESYHHFQNRVPDIAVSRHRPKRYFKVGEAPELVIEILATRRGNVECTEKIGDYALAGIGEYWIVNPFDRFVEIYVLRGEEYVLQRTASTEAISPETFPETKIDLSSLWTA